MQWGAGRAKRRPEGLCPFPSFHIVFHTHVENSYFSTVHNRVYIGAKTGFDKQYIGVAAAPTPYGCDFSTEKLVFNRVFVFSLWKTR